MNLTFLNPLLLTLILSFSQFQYRDLVGDWQLVYFDGIEKVKSSPKYLNSDKEFRQEVEERINYRLENTVYKFKSDDLLEYTDFENRKIVLKSAKIELEEDNIISIIEDNSIKKAKILELDPYRLVIQPISDSPGTGKLVFERIVEEKQKDESD